MWAYAAPLLVHPGQWRAFPGRLLVRAGLRNGVAQTTRSPHSGKVKVSRPAQRYTRVSESLLFLGKARSLLPGEPCLRHSRGQQSLLQDLLDESAWTDSANRDRPSANSACIFSFLFTKYYNQYYTRSRLAAQKADQGAHTGACRIFDFPAAADFFCLRPLLRNKAESVVCLCFGVVFFSQAVSSSETGQSAGGGKTPDP